MACKYIYRGYTFNSELELDGFLLEKQQYLDQYGDIVFNTTAQQLEVARLLDNVHQRAQQVDGEYRVWRRALAQKKLTYGADGELEIDESQKPYIGVNAFLASIQSDRLFPEFRPKDYWNNRKDAWSRGEFNEKELEFFGYTRENAPKILSTDIDPQTGKLIHDVMQERIEAKWKAQALAGTAVHKIMELFFTTLPSGEKVWNKLDIEQYIINNLEAENKTALGSNIDQIVHDTVEHAKVVMQQVRKDIGAEDDEELMFFPEFLLSAEVQHPDSGANQKLLGIADLLIVDGKGKVHVLDYKTSIKPYRQFDQSKKLSYYYQMATYSRILEKYGIDCTGGQLIVAPIQLKNFRLENDQYIFDTIESNQPTRVVNNEIKETYWSKINTFLPPKFNVIVTPDDLHKNVTEWVEKCWPNYQSTRPLTEEIVRKFLDKQGLLKKNDRGEYVYNLGGNEPPIISTDDVDFIKKVTDYRNSLVPRRERTTANVKKALAQAFKEGVDNVDWPKLDIANRGISVNWLADQLRKYGNSRWAIVDNMPVLDQYGIIMLRNTITNQVDFIRISTNMLDINYRTIFLDKKDPEYSRMSLSGHFEEDVVEQQDSNSLMITAAQGNIELMEIMAVINQLTGLGNVEIGNISVINPFDGRNIQASNEELYYCFNAMNRHVPLPKNKFKSGEIKLASKYSNTCRLFRDIMAVAEEHQFRDIYRPLQAFQSCTNILDQSVLNVDDQIVALNKLLDELMSDKDTYNKLSKTYTDSKMLSDDIVSLHNAILTTIAQLKGINFRQQLKDHSEWLEKAMIFRHGWSGTYLDNPGNLDSETLNLVTKLVTEAYQNTRDELQRKKLRIQKEVLEYKQAKGLTAIKDNLGFNQVDIYNDLIEEITTPDGTDLVFKDLSSLTDPAEKKFLTFVLEEINANRFPLKSESELAAMRDSYNIEYYRVPLAKGGAASQVSSRGLLALIKDKLKSWNPKVAFQRARDKAEGIYNAQETTKEQRSREVLYEMTNMFDKGETTERRMQVISTKGIHTFERNLELLLLKHDFAYIQEKNFKKVFPLIKAATIHLCEQGAAQNTTFSKDIGYIQDYIKNKIRNESIVPPEWENLTTIANGIKRAASLLTLAFSPVQALYQPLQGLWQDISLMIRQPDGSDAFTFSHFKKAISIVGQDLFHYSDKPTLCSLLNELYAINDMDMNTYAERISKAKKGIWNFENFMYKFASRPDYYNRMSIFLSQMMGDGCLEAHSLVDGKLVYNWEQDTRFSEFAKNPTGNSDIINEQRSLYYAMAKQFELEHATIEDENGNIVDFKVNMIKPMPLPRAYTNKQAESMKSLADDIYGYYSHEKKSMVMSTALGSMWLQFKTYWSGKKNQYLQSGGVRLRGRWEQRTEKDAQGKEVKLYYQVDAQNNIRYDLPFTTNVTVAPVMQWKGQWQEGILLTLGDIAYNTLQHPTQFVENIKQKWNNPNEDLQRCYRSNIKQAGYDLMMFLIIGSLLGSLLGDWLKDLKDENIDNTNLSTGLKLAAANVMVSSVKNSFLDFNIIDSIGSPVGQWTPFAFEWSARQYKNIAKVATGDEDIWDGVLNIATVNRQVRPIFDSIKPEQFRTKREGGTWESATAIRNRERREQQG